MITICKNCEQKFEGNFSNNCGQKADTPDIDFIFLRNRIKRLIFKYSEKGIFYTCGQLFTRPGNAIRDYIEGKRVRYFEPLSLLITLAAFYGFLFHYYSINMFSDVSISDTEYQKVDLKSINNWITNHFALATGLLIPLYSLGSFIAFRKQCYNFAEHLTINTYLASQRLILRIASFPLLVIFNGSDKMHILNNVYILLDIILLTWSYSQFFNKLTKAKSILLSLVSYIIFFMGFLILMVISLLVWKTLPNS